MTAYDPAGAKRKRKQALTHTKTTKDYADPHVRGRARLAEAAGNDEPPPVYDPAGAKKRRKQALTPSTLDPAE
jgi:hypothetical protein